MPEKSNTKVSNSYRQSFSPWLRFRMLAGNRIKTNPELFNSQYFSDLLNQSRNIKEEKNKITKSLVYLMFISYAILSNQSFKIPYSETSLAEIPFIIEILIVLASGAYFILSIKFADDQCYGAAIDGYVSQYIHDDLLTSHLYKMSVADESSLFVALTTKYRFIEKERELLPGKRAKLYSSLLLFFNIILLFLLIVAPAIFLTYWSWCKIDGGVV